MKKENKKPDSTGDNKQEENKSFPGYPHYNKKEDIMTGSQERVDTNVDNLSGSGVPILKDMSADKGLPLETETPKTPAAESLEKKAAINFNPNDDDSIE